MEQSTHNTITFFGRTNFRNSSGHRPQLFGIRRKDRLSSFYAIGKTGTGKSTLLATLVKSDILSGQGFALLDPHGDLVERVLPWAVKHRQKDLIYFNVPDRNQPLAFNPLENVPPEQRPLVVSGLLEAFKKIWYDNWGPRVEHVMRNSLLTLLDQPQATLGDVLRLLDEPDFRKEALKNVRNAQVERFWTKEYKYYTFGIRAMVNLPIQNKIGAFLANPILREIVIQPKSSFDLRRVMDEGKILLVNLAKGKIGEDTASLLGALLITKIGLAGLSRADVSEESRRDFLVYADEAANVATLSLANMMAELRKFHVGMVLAHQYLSQLNQDIRDAILGNVGTLVSFRLGASDARFIAQELDPTFQATDLINLPNYNVYLKMMIDGKPSKPFSAEILTPSEVIAADAQR